MKVEITELRLAMTAIGEKICVGIPDSKQSFRHQHDVTNDFIHTLIDWCVGYKKTITDSNGNKYEITVKKIK